MPDPRPPSRRNTTRRTFLGGVGAVALGITGLETALAGAARAGALASAAAGNTAAPRPYFPSDVTRIPPTASLPDLFTFFSPLASPDRSPRVTRPRQWPARAAELSDLMQYYLFGYKHPTPADGSVFRKVTIPATATAPAREGLVVDVTDPGAAGSTTATITIDDFSVPVQGTDTGIPGPYPAVLVVGSLPPEQVATLKASGYGYLAMNTGSVYSDWNGTTNPHTGAYNELYPYQAGVYEFDSGALMGWAWGISRIVDAIKNDAAGANMLNLAWDKTAVTGVSRNGKAAALAGAFDPRIAVTAPSDPGGGGLTGFRNMTEAEMFTYNVPAGFEAIYSLNETAQRAIGNPSEAGWFTSKAQEFFPGNALHAPFDLHAVPALVAPRPFIGWTGEAQQAWLGSPSAVLSMQAGREVYELLGAAGDIGWIVRDAHHANQDRDLPDLIAIMDRTFGRGATLTRRRFASLADAGGAALDGSGMIYPEKTFDSINAMTRNPYDIENYLVPWSRPGKHSLWSEDTYVTAGLSRVLTFRTDTPRVALTLPDGTRLVKSAPRGVATFLLTAAQAQTGRYVAQTMGSDGDAKRIELAGFSLSDALRHGLNLTSGVPEGMSVGFSSPLANYGDADDPVALYVNGGQITTSIADDGKHQGYVERYGASLKLPGAPAGPWDGTVSFAFSVRNIKLQALPGFTFAVDIPLTKTQVPSFGGPLVNGYSSPQGETPSWNSADLQNTPYSGNFHGRWPLFPNSSDDTGARPVSVPNQTGFAATITAADATPAGVTLRFSEPLNPDEFGVGLDAAASWTTQWAADATSVRIAYGAALAPRQDVTVLVFRAVDTAGNMIGAPVRLTATAD